MVLLLIVVYKAVLTFETVDEILQFTLQDFIQMKAAEQYFAVLLFYYVVNLSYNFWVSGQIPEMLGHSNESSSGIRLHGTSLCPF